MTGSSDIFHSACLARSKIQGIPNGRFVPSDLGIYILFKGWVLDLLRNSSAARCLRFGVVQISPSIPGVNFPEFSCATILTAFIRADILRFKSLWRSRTLRCSPFSVAFVILCCNLSMVFSTLDQFRPVHCVSLVG